ncbi:hypothetical protein ACWDT5_10580 [Rhodococcus aetherivorans]
MTDNTELERLRAEVDRLTRRVDRLDRELAAHRQVADAIRRAQFWDFTPYELVPDGSWIAVDRADAVALLRALAATDHWRPWTHTLEPRGAV